MRYIQLNNDSLIIYTSEGLITITNKSFNFHKIKRLLDKGAEEEDVIHLLATPKLDNGIFEAYLDKIKDALVYKWYPPVSTVDPIFYSIEGVAFYGDECNMPKEFLGVYPSVKDILMDWPEYVI